MGECCSKQTDEPVNLQKQVNVKVIDNLEDIEQIKRTHGPYEIDAVEIKSDEENPENEPVQRKRVELGEFHRQPVKEFSGLHELGPYKYENGATYTGQYLNH